MTKVDIYAYWGDPPPERSPNLIKWLGRIASGFRRNRRLRQMSYETAADFFGVYLWEYQKVLQPIFLQFEEENETNRSV